MRLHAAASMFDKQRCQDAYDSSSVFYAQFDLFDDSKRDGLTVARRVMSVSPAVVLPARRAFLLGSEYWLIGDPHTDFFFKDPIRVRHVVQRAQGLLKYQTPAECLSTGGTDAYGARVWIKDMKEVEISSGAYSFYSIFFAPNELVTVGSIVTCSGRLHRVRNVYTGAAGMLVAEANELAAGALVTGATYTPKNTGLNPVTDVVTPGANVTLNSLRMRWQDDYLYPNEAAPRFEEGDIKVLITKAAVATAKKEDTITFSDGVWRVVAVEDEGLCWGLHMRHA